MSGRPSDADTDNANANANANANTNLHLTGEEEAMDPTQGLVEKTGCWPFGQNKPRAASATSAPRTPGTGNTPNSGLLGTNEAGEGAWTVVGRKGKKFGRALALASVPVAGLVTMGVFADKAAKTAKARAHANGVNKEAKAKYKAAVDALQTVDTEAQTAIPDFFTGINRNATDLTKRQAFCETLAAAGTLPSIPCANLTKTPVITAYTPCAVLQPNERPECQQDGLARLRSVLFQQRGFNESFNATKILAPHRCSPEQNATQIPGPCLLAGPDSHQFETEVGLAVFGGAVLLASVFVAWLYKRSNRPPEPGLGPSINNSAQHSVP